MTVQMLLAVAALLLVILDIVLPRTTYALHAATLCLALALLL